MNGLVHDFEAAEVAYADAKKQSGSEQVLDFNLAHSRVRLRLADPALAPLLARAFRHLEARNEGTVDLEIFAWTGGLGPEPELLQSIKDPATMAAGTEALTWVQGKQSDVVVKYPGPQVQRLDRDHRRGFFWAATADIPLYESAAPLRYLLQMWLRQRKSLVVHAGAVGNGTGGVLLAGASGRGKSTSTLACLGSELRMIADDLCAVSLGDSPNLFSLFGAAKLNADQAAHLTGAGPGMSIPESRDRTKFLYFPGEFQPDAVLAGTALKGIFLPLFKGGRDTCIMAASKGEAVRALLASPTLIFPSQRETDFHDLVRLAGRVPVCWLETGTDLAQIPRCISAWLEKQI